MNDERPRCWADDPDLEDFDELAEFRLQRAQTTVDPKNVEHENKGTGEDLERMMSQSEVASDRFETASHFSDSSSEGEEPMSFEENLQSENWLGSTEAGEEDKEPQSLDQLLVDVAQTNLPRESLKNGAILPYALDREGEDGEIRRRDYKYLESGGRVGRMHSRAHSHGLPSRFNLEERHRVQRDLARKQRDGLAKELNESLDQRNFWQQSAQEAEEEAVRLRTAIEDRQERLMECKIEIEKTRVEAEQWKSSFRKQRPFAMAERERRMRKEQGLDGGEDAGTQTEDAESSLFAQISRMVEATTQTEKDDQETSASVISMVGAVTQTEAGPADPPEDQEDKDQLEAQNRELEFEIEELRQQVMYLEQSLTTSDTIGDKLREEAYALQSKIQRLDGDLKRMEAGVREAVSALPEDVSSSVKLGSEQTQADVGYELRIAEIVRSVAQDGDLNIRILCGCNDKSGWSSFLQFLVCVIFIWLFFRSLPVIVRPWPI